jgi:hypothetical protein
LGVVVDDVAEGGGDVLSLVSLLSVTEVCVFLGVVAGSDADPKPLPPLAKSRRDGVDDRCVTGAKLCTLYRRKQCNNCNIFIMKCPHWFE